MTAGEVLLLVACVCFFVCLLGTLYIETVIAVYCRRPAAFMIDWPGLEVYASANWFCPSRSPRHKANKCGKLLFSSDIYIVSFARYGDLLVEIANFFIPRLYLAQGGDPVGIS